MNSLDYPLLPKDCNKAKGMDIVLEYFNMNLEQSIAFGDSMNDLEMIRHANIGIGMEDSDKRS